MKTKTALPLSYLFAFLLAMGCFPAACFLLSLLTHVQRSPPVPLLSSLFFKIQHVGACRVERQQQSLLARRCHRNVHLEAVREGLFHAEWECAREKRGETGRTVLMLTLPPPPPPPPPPPLLFFLSTFTNTHLQARSPKVHSHLLCLRGAQLATLSSALRGRQGVEAGEE